MQQSIPSPTQSRWLTIWTQPRATIRQVIDVEAEKYTILIVLLFGILSTFDTILGPVVGATLVLLTFYLYTFVLRWVGSWFGGSSSNEAMRITVAWGYYLPLAQTYLALLLPAILTNIFKLEALSYTSLIVLIVMNVWALTITWRTIAEAHQFSVVKAFSSSLIAGLILLLPIAAIAFSIGYLSGLS